MPNTVTTEKNFKKLIDTFINFVESSLCPQSSTPIYIGCDSIPPNHIFYNTEQLSYDGAVKKVLDHIKKGNPVKVWDYSLANVEILKKHNIIARHVPLESPGWYIKELQSYRKNGQEYDVGFTGLMTARRLNILNKLKELGITVNILDGVFGKKRDKELAKCKILLNIHAFPHYKIFESNRCEPWLKAGVTIISENSLDNDARCINVIYSDIIKTVKKRIKEYTD